MNGYVSPSGLTTAARRAQEDEATQARLVRLKGAVLRARAHQHALRARQTTPPGAGIAGTGSSLAKALGAGRTGHAGAQGPTGHADPARWAYGTLPVDHSTLTERSHYLAHLCLLINQGSLPKSVLTPTDWSELELDPLTGDLTVKREAI